MRSVKTAFCALLLALLPFNSISVSPYESDLDPSYRTSDYSNEDEDGVAKTDWSSEDEELGSKDDLQKPYVPPFDSSVDFDKLQRDLHCIDAVNRCACNFHTNQPCLFSCAKLSLPPFMQAMNKRVKCTCQWQDYHHCRAAPKLAATSCINGFFALSSRKCVCDPGYFGDRCQQRCIFGRRVSNVCRCNEGYTGDLCDTRIPETTPLTTPYVPIDCYHGEIVNGKCLCDEEFIGDDCGTFKPIPSPNPTHCVNGYYKSSGGQCVCYTGYTGNDCSTQLQSDFSTRSPEREVFREPHPSNICVNGVYIYGFDSGYCRCHEGYSGWDCSIRGQSQLEYMTTARYPLPSGQSGWRVYDRNQTRWWMQVRSNNSHIVQPFMLKGQSVESGTMGELYKGVPLLFIVSLVAVVAILLFGSLLIVVLVRNRRVRADNSYAPLTDSEAV